MSILDRIFKNSAPQKSNVLPLHMPAGGELDASIARVNAKLDSGDLEEAREMAFDLVAAFPGNETVFNLRETVFSAMVSKRFPGTRYLQWLEWFHQRLKPSNYVEIGVETGRSLAYAKPPTVGVGVDPGFQIIYPQETWVKLFKLPSDDFFSKYNLSAVLGADTVDFAFIDGLHTYDQALKDFMNIERYSTPKTIVLFHDVSPVVPITALRDRKTTMWVGDTWKAMQVLLKYRPDLKMFMIPTAPSGLGVVTNLDANSRVLERDFDKIFREAMDYDIEAHLPEINKFADATPNDFDVVAKILGI